MLNNCGRRWTWTTNHPFRRAALPSGFVGASLLSINPLSGIIRYHYLKLLLSTPFELLYHKIFLRRVRESNPIVISEWVLQTHSFTISSYSSYIVVNTGIEPVQSVLHTDALPSKLIYQMSFYWLILIHHQFIIYCGQEETRTPITWASITSCIHSSDTYPYY